MPLPVLPDARHMAASRSLCLVSTSVCSACRHVPADAHWLTHFAMFDLVKTRSLCSMDVSVASVLQKSSSTSRQVSRLGRAEQWIASPGTNLVLTGLQTVQSPYLGIRTPYNFPESRSLASSFKAFPFLSASPSSSISRRRWGSWQHPCLS